MKKNYLVSVSYTAVLPSGKTKTIREKVLVSAISYQDAEVKVLEEFSAYDSLSILAMKTVNFSEIVSGEFDTEPVWFKITVGMTIYDEVTGNERIKKIPCLVEGISPENAISNLNKYLRNSVSDYRIVSIAESGICAVLS